MTEQEKQEGLWRNCEDSIRHALEHFRAGASEDEPFHHHKWALLSVAHAAEATATCCSAYLIRSTQRT